MELAQGHILKTLKSTKLIILLSSGRILQRITMFLIVINLLGTTSPPDLTISHVRDEQHIFSYYSELITSAQEELNILNKKKDIVNNAFDQMINGTIEPHDLKNLFDLYGRYIVGRQSLYFFYEDIKIHGKKIGVKEKNRIKAGREDTNKRIKASITSLNNLLKHYNEEITRANSKKKLRIVSVCSGIFSN